MAIVMLAVLKPHDIICYSCRCSRSSRARIRSPVRLGTIAMVMLAVPTPRRCVL
jgi:hypothetical protein